MSRLVHCRRCGALFVPDRLMRILPPRWRLCSRCRGPLPPAGTVVVRDSGPPLPELPGAAP